MKKTIPVENSFELKPILRGKWQGGVSHIIDKTSKKLATEYTPAELMDEILTGGIHSILYWVDKDNSRGPAPANPDQDPQFALWEYPVTLWALQRGITSADEDSVPTSFDDVHNPALSPKITIVSPVKNAKFDLNQKISISLQSQGKYPMSRVDYFVDNIFVGDMKNYPFIFSFTPSDLDIKSGTHTLKVVVYDSVLNKSEAEVEFSIN